ncbi:drosomycin-like [Drosophila takahashii]|uniref:drosomycin-like n=1 Tax=Drosophila takahashii TaxID=29030 RepID=UPI001CF929DA|nr:drosomycin-like [Drosophila takahashii]
MVQIKFLFALLAVMTIVVLEANVADADDCLSGRFSGPCWAWSDDQCRSLCKDEGHVSGHCGGMKCWCEDC